MKNSIYKGFISYAHTDKLYFNLLHKGIAVHSRHLDIEWEIWEDTQIPIGSMWHTEIQQKVQDCDFAVLLISSSFLYSEYIAEFELKEFICRDYCGNFLIFPILINPCTFHKHPEISQRQFFMPQGDEFGCPHIPDMTYADLVRFNSDGQVLPNPNRERYHIKLVESLLNSIEGTLTNKKNVSNNV